MKSIVLYGVVLLAACGGESGIAPDAPGGGPRADAAIDGPALDAPTSSCAHPRTVFLNRAGGMYSPGADDARTNASPVIDEMRTLGAFPLNDAAWTTMKACVTTELAKFGPVVVTDVDPGTAPHHEIVFTTKYWDMAHENQVSSLSGATCTAAPANGIAFVFASLIGDDPQFLCEAALWQLAVDIANLDWSIDCRDMQSSYLNGCGNRKYLDADVKCGEYAARDCRCGGTTQNSFKAMRSAMCD
jgi:hypothetical protein